MISARWLEKRRPYWHRLENIVERSGRRGLSVLSHQEVQELGLLYRQVAADLSSVREDPMSERLAAYLNQLLGRAHNLIYMGRRTRPGGILGFYRTAFPRVFRETFSYTLAAFAVFLAAAVAGFLICLADPWFQRFFLGPAMSDTIERRQMWTHSILTIKPLASSFIMTNNLAVSFTTFALGVTAGLGTVYMMATNGLLLGIISAACWQAGMGLELAEFVTPHGVLELPAIFIAGGGGLLIARGLLFPGSLPRRDALVVYGGEGVRLALGIIPLLIVAGMIEAFVSPSMLPAPVKFVFAFAVGGLLVLYVTQAGRTPHPRPTSGKRKQIDES
ncbi:MAG: hypothetical protein DMG24_09285 [Acidobacteria bacterium]|nr:MAG: hypothetical protein DMG24_09285 [Acidobacteriota bacterium]